MLRIKNRIVKNTLANFLNLESVCQRIRRKMFLSYQSV